MMFAAQMNLKFLQTSILRLSIPKILIQAALLILSQTFVSSRRDSFALARTVEYFRIPRDVLVICLGKSTYARCGIIVNVTPSSNPNGKGMSHWSFPIQQRYRQKLTPTKVLHKCFWWQ
jgi:hypothetical protein